MITKIFSEGNRPIGFVIFIKVYFKKYEEFMIPLAFL